LTGTRNYIPYRAVLTLYYFNAVGLVLVPLLLKVIWC